LKLANIEVVVVAVAPAAAAAAVGVGAVGAAVSAYAAAAVREVWLTVMGRRPFHGTNELVSQLGGVFYADPSALSEIRGGSVCRISQEHDPTRG